MIMIDAGHLINWDEEFPALPRSGFSNGARVSVSADGQDTGGTMLQINYTELAVNNATVDLKSSDGSYANGIGGYQTNRVSLDGGTVEIDLADGMGIDASDMVIGATGAIDIKACLSGIRVANLFIGDESQPSAATISVVSADMGIEASEHTEIFGIGKDHASVTVQAGTPGEPGWIGSVFRGPHIANTKVESTMVSREATGMMLSMFNSPIPTLDVRDGDAEPFVGIVDNATVIANGTDVGLEIQGDTYRFTESIFEASASGSVVESQMVPFATPITYPTAAILSHPGELYVDATVVEANGADYGWLSTGYQQPPLPDPYSLYDDEWDYDNTRIFAGQDTSISAVGDVSGIALSGSIEAKSGASVTGTARLVDVYAPEANDVAAIDISNYYAGKNEIRADGGTVAEHYLVPVSEALADNESEAFNPYKGAWNMAKPSNYEWTANHPQVLLAANETGVYTTSGTGSAESGIEVKAERTAGVSGEKVVVGSENSSHSIALLTSIRPQDTITYLVQFDPNGGEPKPADQTVARAASAVEPAGADKPVLAGYTLEGWYSDEGLTDKWNFADPVMSDMILYAKWVEDKQPTPPGPVDPDPDPDNPKPIDTAKGLAKAGDAPVAMLIAALALAGAVGAFAAIRARKRNER